MDKLIVQEGGMPLRIADLGWIHDIYKSAFKAVIDGLNGLQSCILSGITSVVNGGGIVCHEGYYYDGNEIFYVAQQSFSVQSGYKLYLTRTDTTTENRTFYDETTHDCYALRRYVAGYAATVPDGSLELSEIIRIEDIVDAQTLAVIIDNMSLANTGTSASYASGFTAVGSYPSVQLNKNPFGDVMILAAFSSTVINGKICTLPVGYRPTADVITCYYAGSTLQVLIIKTSGDVWVKNANGSTNYISFQFNILHTDQVQFSVPLPDPD